MIFRQGVGRFDQFHAADLVAPILVEPDANQNALVGEHENGIAVHGQMNARRGAALPVGNFVSLPDLIRRGTMRHATVCRQDAGSTFGVTFRPPLNTYSVSTLGWRPKGRESRIRDG